MPPESYRFVVTGRVQGVFFRQSAVKEAQRLKLSGWVRNREDGAVEGLACGESGPLQHLRAWLQRGPPAARVEAVDWQPSTQTPEPGFGVRS